MKSLEEDALFLLIKCVYDKDFPKNFHLLDVELDFGFLEQCEVESDNLLNVFEVL
jgi:hypothetical protein